MAEGKTYLSQSPIQESQHGSVLEIAEARKWIPPPLWQIHRPDNCLFKNVVTSPGPVLAGVLCVGVHKVANF
jgi:hypothetical protein